MNISDNKITEALEAEVEKDISLLFPFIENEVNELALDAMRMAQLRIELFASEDRNTVLALSRQLSYIRTKFDCDYQAALTKYIEYNFDRKEAELQEEAQEERECAAEARADADREERLERERYDCAIHGRQDGPDCPRC